MRSQARPSRANTNQPIPRPARSARMHRSLLHTFCKVNKAQQQDYYTRDLVPVHKATHMIIAKWKWSNRSNASLLGTLYITEHDPQVIKGIHYYNWPHATHDSVHLSQRQSLQDSIQVVREAKRTARANGKKRHVQRLDSNKGID